MIFIIILGDVLGNFFFNPYKVCTYFYEQMPIMNGYEATKLIRMEEQHYGIHIPIIALTAHAMAEDASKTMRAGMDFHLTKPLREDTLLDAIRCIEMK